MRIKTPKLILFLLCFLCFLSISLTVAHAIEIKKELYPNGLTVIHVQRNNLPIVVMTMLIKASPLNESQEKAGTAYLTARMLTEGTSKRTSTDISDEIEYIGASIEASTNYDYTTISFSSLKKDIEKGFEIFSDIILNPIFPDEEIKRKKDLIKSGIKKNEEEPDFMAETEFIKQVYGSHPYGRRVEGNLDSIDKIERDDILKFYNEYYMPGNGVLSVVGNITPEELNLLLNKYFSQWKNRDIIKPQEDMNAIENTSKEPRTIIINKDITQANIFFGHLGLARENPDYYAVTVMNYILGGGGFASRLMKTVRDDMGLAYSINSSFSASKYIGRFEVEVQTKNESAGIVVKEILNQVKKIMTEGVSDEELNDAKSYLTGSFPRRLETSRRIADFLPAVEFYNLGDSYIEKYPEYINSLTKEDILRAAQKYLNPENYVLVIVGNEQKIKLDPKMQFVI